MTQVTRFAWPVPVLSDELGYSELDDPVSVPSNFAAASNGSFAFVKLSTIGGPIQEATGSAGVADSSVSATLGETPTTGNTLIAVLAYRGTGTSHADPSGWTKHSDVQGPAFDGGRMIFYSKSAAGASATLTIDCTAIKKSLYLAEWPDVLTFDADVEVDSQPADTTMVTDALTPGVTGGVLFAGFNQSARNPSIALQSPFTESWDRDVDSSGPSVVFGYRLVPDFIGAYTATAISNQSDGYGAFLASFSIGSAAVWEPAPALIDGLPATYEECTAGDEVIRLDITTPQTVGRAILRTAAASNGTYNYSLAGTNDAEFVTTSHLSTVTVAELAGFTEQNVTFLWPPGLPYQYYQISIDGEAARRFHELELFETVGVSSIASNALALGGVVVQNSAASNDSYVAISSTAGVWAPRTTIAHASNSFSGVVTLTTPGNTVGITSPTTGTYALTASGGSGGSGSGQGLVDFAQILYTSGDITCDADNIWEDLAGVGDITLTAASGQWIEVGFSAMCANSTAVAIAFDCATIVSAAVVNHISQGGSPDNAKLGVSAWRISGGSTHGVGGTVLYQLVSGDISGGTVTLRLRDRPESTSNRDLSASTARPLHFWAKNLGGSL